MSATATGPWLDPRFAEGAAHYDAGRYFEAHEAWEHLWRAQPAGQEKTWIQGLIQLAVSLEHHRRGNPRGREGQWAKAMAKLDAPRAGPVDLAATIAAARAALGSEPPPSGEFLSRPRVCYSAEAPA
ncbi:MAG: DUF309 domain-containing protein [Deltaproteobacteria bacterium]|nr:DUF309 domain-containing protein [Deltaproteobacteria bacterium]